MKPNKCWPCVHYSRYGTYHSLVFREQCLIGANLGEPEDCPEFEYEPGSDFAVAEELEEG